MVDFVHFAQQGDGRPSRDASNICGGGANEVHRHLQCLVPLPVARIRSLLNVMRHLPTGSKAVRQMKQVASRAVALEYYNAVGGEGPLRLFSAPRRLFPCQRITFFSFSAGSLFIPFSHECPGRTPSPTIASVATRLPDREPVRLGRTGIKLRFPSSHHRPRLAHFSRTTSRLVAGTLCRESHSTNSQRPSSLVVGSCFANTDGHHETHRPGVTLRPPHQNLAEHAAGRGRVPRRCDYLETLPKTLPVWPTGRAFRVSPHASGQRNLQHLVTPDSNARTIAGGETVQRASWADPTPVRFVLRTSSATSSPGREILLWA